MILSLPASKMKKIRAEARKMENQVTMSARELSCLLGKMPILSQPPNEPVRGFEREHTVLQINSDPLPRQQGGAGMVGQPDEELEREKSPEEGDRPDNRLGCFSDGMGSILSAPEDWGSMVRRREVDAHKLSGIAGSNSSDPDICKRPERFISATENRQHHGSSIYKQPWGHSLQGTTEASKNIMDVVPGETHNSTTPTRGAEPHG